MAGGAVLPEPASAPKSNKFVHMRIVAAPSTESQTHLVFSDGQKNIRPLWHVKVVSS